MRRSVCVHVCTYVHAYVYAGGCAYACTHAHAYACDCTGVRVRMCAYVCALAGWCTCVRACAYYMHE